MIPDISIPEYYIESLDLNANPEPSETTVGHVTVEFEMHSPELFDEPEGFASQLELSLELFEGEWTNDDKKEFGNVDVEGIVFVEGSRDSLDTFHSQWTEGSYTDMDGEFIDHIESGILPKLLVPVANLVNNSFDGVLPRMRFTPPDAEEDE
jgi:hypothetical protein